jgi:hypothetical protein
MGCDSRTRKLRTAAEKREITQGLSLGAKTGDPD